LSVIIDQKICVGCGLCVEICPARAITTKNCVANLDESKCNDCGFCERMCLVSALTYTGPVSKTK
jgi:Fe-S-cluster-containing hydrogenase component 2